MQTTPIRMRDLQNKSPDALRRVAARAAMAGLTIDISGLTQEQASAAVGGWADGWDMLRACRPQPSDVESLTKRIADKLPQGALQNAAGFLFALWFFLALVW